MNPARSFHISKPHSPWCAQLCIQRPQNELNQPHILLFCLFCFILFSFLGTRVWIQNFTNASFLPYVHGGNFQTIIISNAFRLQLLPPESWLVKISQSTASYIVHGIWKIRECRAVRAASSALVWCFVMKRRPLSTVIINVSYSVHLLLLFIDFSPFY